MADLTKKYYKISEVTELLGLPASTLRFWEKQFTTVLKPHRTDGGTRYYTPADIETLRMINYLVRERGFKIEKAQEIIRHNHTGVSKHYMAIKRLHSIREHLVQLLAAIDSSKR